MKRFNSQRLAALPAAVALFALPGTPAFAQPYHAIDLGTLDPATTSTGLAMNNFGQVVGTSVADFDLQAFLWEGTTTAIPALAGDEQSQAFAINDAAQAVAMSFDLGETNVHGLLWETGLVTDLGALAPRAINDLGRVAGYWSTSTASIALADRAATWQGGTLTDLGTLGGNFSYAAAVSNWGQVVGWSYTSGDSNVRATLWQNGAVFDLGTLGGPSSQAYAISRESGHVAGVADAAAGNPHAFLYRVNAAGTVTLRTDLGVLGGGSSYAYGVNNLGQVVGTSNSRAFRWQSGVMSDLNSLLAPGAGWQLERAHSINEAGLIAGAGLHLGQPRGFLMARVGDVTADGLVDLSDHAGFVPCLAGPGVTTPPVSCSPFDFAMSDSDGDSDADMADFAAMQRALATP